MKNNDKYDLVKRGYDHPIGFFDPLFDDFFRMPMFDRKEMNRLNTILKTDIKEGENSYTLDIEMPGIDKKDIDIDLRDGYLTISAKKEKKISEENKKENYIRREQSYGHFSRSFYVGDVKKEDIDAKLESGILQIVLPKEQKKIENSSKIEIK